MTLNKWALDIVDIWGDYLAQRDAGIMAGR